MGCIDPVHSADCSPEYRKALWNAAEYGVLYNEVVARHFNIKTRKVDLKRMMFENQTAAVLDEEIQWARICIELEDVNAIYGGQDLVICGSGDALVRVVMPGTGDLEENIYTWKCRDTDFHRVLKSMIDTDFFTLQPSSRYGVPDEPRPTITVTDGTEVLFSMEDWLEPAPPPSEEPLPLSRGFTSVYNEILRLVRVAREEGQCMKTSPFPGRSKWKKYRKDFRRIR